jgi:hypothetical protein
MNLNEWAASLIARRDALNDIMIKFASEGGALTAISDFCDDSDSIPDPELRDLMLTLLGDAIEITAAAEKIYLIGGIDLGTRFCLMNELCARCFSDLEVCDCSDDE